MTCKEQTALLVECARSGDAPDAALRAHLACCAACNARWRAERDLTVRLGGLTTMADAAEIASRTRRDARAAALIAGFGDGNLARSAVIPMKASRTASWGWALSVAAAFLLAVGVGYGAGTRTRHRVASPAIRTHGAPTTGSVVYEVSADADSLSNDDSGGDFIAVPFALPLAEGEIVHVVHSELYPQALASMGIDVNPEWLDSDSGEISADVVVGQDGFPRAVRISDTTEF